MAKTNPLSVEEALRIVAEGASLGALLVVTRNAFAERSVGDDDRRVARELHELEFFYAMRFAPTSPLPRGGVLPRSEDEAVWVAGRFVRMMLLAIKAGEFRNVRPPVSSTETTVPTRYGSRTRVLSWREESPEDVITDRLVAMVVEDFSSLPDARAPEVQAGTRAYVVKKLKPRYTKSLEAKMPSSPSPFVEAVLVRAGMGRDTAHLLTAHLRRVYR